MKSILAISAFLTLSLSLYAQPIITRNHLVVAGDEVNIASVDAAPAPGPSGANVTWNFASLQPSSSAHLDVEEADDTPYTSDFPGANIAFVDNTPGAQSYQYLSLTNSSWDEEGNVYPDVWVTYTDPRTYLQFPLTYNDQWQDGFEYTIEYFTIPPYYTYGEGNVDARVDGYGTLVLPQAIFTDALRVRIIGNATDTTDLGFGLAERNHFRDTTYVWLSPSANAPLAAYTGSVIMRTTTVISSDTTSFDETITFKGFSYDPIAEPSSAIADVKPNLYGLQISPNPVEDIMEIVFMSDKVQDMIFSLKDLHGHTVYDRHITAHANTNRIDVTTTDIPSGHYLAMLQSTNGIDIQKVIRIADRR